MISFLPSAQAATTIQVSFSETYMGLEDENIPETKTNVKDSAADKQAKSSFSKALKSKSTLKSLESICRNSDNFGARVKVTNSNGGTAGLGNLNSFAVKNIKMVESLSDLPDFTEEEEEQRRAAEDAWNEDEENYYGEWPDPDFIEEGYRYWTLNFDCLFNSKVAVTTSNTYSFFIDGKAGPEYTRAELSKMKWRITLVRT